MLLAPPPSHSRVLFWPLVHLWQVLDKEIEQDLFKYSTIVTGAEWPPAYQPKSPCPTLKVVGAVTNVMSEDHLDLTGQGIYVNVNDTGVDDSHAAFGNRIKGWATSDSDGHGTFVAGIIAGDGAGSDTIKTNPPPGSLKDPDFMGMAPKARLHVLRSDDRDANNHVSDRWLQTESANYHYFKSPKQKYALISNNSWEYEEENDYTWAAASYDAATRDALPDQPGDQQVTYVFPAGNSGAGTDNGLNASPNTITAPGTAKNVITVGAIESGREIVACLLYTSPSPRDYAASRMPSSA